MDHGYWKTTRKDYEFVKRFTISMWC